MTREELKEILSSIVDNMDQTPQPACIFGDEPVDPEPVMRYAITEPPVIL